MIPFMGKTVYWVLADFSIVNFKAHNIYIYICIYIQNIFNHCLKTTTVRFILRFVMWLLIQIELSRMSISVDCLLE